MVHVEFLCKEFKNYSKSGCSIFFSFFFFFLGVSIRPGSVIKHYRIQSVLGEGSSGQVFTASNAKGQTVVMKFIPLKNSWFQKEFEREVNSLSKCGDCPLIVKMIQSFKHKSYGVIVLEKLRGDLLDYLQLHQPLSVEYVKNIFFQLCVAILFLHKRCIAHLDIKPENIFMSSATTIKLGDFGSSYIWKDDFESKLGAVGTSYYCAPEVGPSLPYNPCKADTWSLGILLHVLLTGFWPYKGKNEATLHENVKYGRTEIFIDSLPEDDALMDLLDSLLCHDPQVRYSVNEALASEWLQSVGAPKTKLRGGSTPNLHISLDTIDLSDDVEEEPQPNLRQSKKLKNDDVDVFTFSDEERTDPDFDNTWDLGEVPTQSPCSRALEDDVVAPNSLPKQLTAEPMKTPRTMISMPTTSDSARAAPIKKKNEKKGAKRRKNSLLNFFSSGGKKSRRSSAADSCASSRSTGLGTSADNVAPPQTLS